MGMFNHCPLSLHMHLSSASHGATILLGGFTFLGWFCHEFTLTTLAGQALHLCHWSRQDLHIWLCTMSTLKLPNAFRTFKHLQMSHVLIAICYCNLESCFFPNHSNLSKKNKLCSTCSSVFCCCTCFGTVQYHSIDFIISIFVPNPYLQILL